MSEEFVCKNCGVCCLKSPCIFAQVNHNVHAGMEVKCPELSLIGDKFECLLIKRNQEAREVLVGNGCDDPKMRYLKPTFDAGDIVKEYFPDATDKDIEYILWEQTNFPGFWRIPDDGWTASQCLRTELKRLKHGRVNSDVKS